MNYSSLSPLDYRYYDKALAPYLSEEAAVHYQAQVEVALVAELAEEGICSKKVASEIAKAAQKVKAEDVYKEEAVIKHNIRALVNVMKRHVSKQAKPYIHLTATSMDIVNTADSARVKDVVDAVVVPELVELERTLINIARQEKDTVQIGRTHGQHAEPITFGFALAEYVDRLGGRIDTVRDANKELRGKLSGAVGAYNASSIFIKNPVDFESKVLKRLGLQPARHATQIVEPEYLLDLHHSLASTFGVLASLADDLRHLQRSEIKEVAEHFQGKQVGSSTMPHKRNPIHFENVKSLWKAFVPRMMTGYMDQLSEHQRDLTNSASGKFTLELISGVTIAAKRLRRVLDRLVVDKEHMTSNFRKAADMVVAEPAYLLLAKYGHPDAHEIIRQLTLRAEHKGTLFVDELRAEDSVKEYTAKFSQSEWNMLKEPETYVGLAPKRTEAITKYWEGRLNEYGLS